MPCPQSNLKTIANPLVLGSKLLKAYKVSFKHLLLPNNQKIVSD